MKSLISTLAAAVVLAVAGIAAAPADAAAQCHWGCACTGSACGCNSNGNGGRCDAGATGCVVSGCNVERAELMVFAPDGSLARLAANEDEGRDGSMSRTLGADELGGTTRWEAVADGVSVARHCSGLVIARYYDRMAAATLRGQTETLAI